MSSPYYRTPDQAKPDAAPESVTAKQSDNGAVGLAIQQEQQVWGGLPDNAVQINQQPASKQAAKTSPAIDPPPKPKNAAPSEQRTEQYPPEFAPAPGSAGASHKHHKHDNHHHRGHHHHGGHHRTVLSNSQLDANALNNQVLADGQRLGQWVPTNMVDANPEPGNHVIPAGLGKGAVFAEDLPPPTHTRTALKIHQPKPGSQGAPSIATDDKKTVGPGPLMGSGRRPSPGGMI